MHNKMGLLSKYQSRSLGGVRMPEQRKYFRDT